VAKSSRPIATSSVSVANWYVEFCPRREGRRQPAPEVAESIGRRPAAPLRRVGQGCQVLVRGLGPRVGHGWPPPCPFGRTCLTLGGVTRAGSTKSACSRTNGVRRARGRSPWSGTTRPAPEGPPVRIAVADSGHGASGTHRDDRTERVFRTSSASLTSWYHPTKRQ